MNDSWESRIAQYITASGAVVIPPRIARWIENRAQIPPDLRSRLQDTDPEAHCVLHALHLVANDPMTASGLKSDVEQRDPEELETWLSSATAARELNADPRTIRRWCDTGRLPARKAARDWQIRRADLHIMNKTA